MLSTLPPDLQRTLEHDNRPSITLHSAPLCWFGPSVLQGEVHCVPLCNSLPALHAMLDSACMETSCTCWVHSGFGGEIMLHAGMPVHAWVTHPLVRDLGDVQQGLVAAGEVNEGAIVCQPVDLDCVALARLRLLCTVSTRPLVAMGSDIQPTGSNALGSRWYALCTPINHDLRSVTGAAVSTWTLLYQVSATALQNKRISHIGVYGWPHIYAMLPLDRGSRTHWHPACWERAYSHHIHLLCCVMFNLFTQPHALSVT